MWSNVLGGNRVSDGKVDSLFITELKKALNNEVVERDIVDKNVKFRASGYGLLCERKYALATISREPLDPPNDGDCNSNWLFGIGHAYHGHFQEGWLRSLGDVFQGWWRCRTCGQEFRGEENPTKYLSHKWIPKPESCDCTHYDEFDENVIDEEFTDYELIKYGFTKEDLEKLEFENKITKLQLKRYKQRVLEQEKLGFEYVELEFKDPDTGNTGHCDGILEWDAIGIDKPVEVLELKTIGSLEYVNPENGGDVKQEHVVQVIHYVMYAGLEIGRIVYILKGENNLGKSLLEFEVKFNQKIIDKYAKKMDNIRDNVIKILDSEYMSDEKKYVSEKWLKKDVQLVPVELKKLLPERCEKCQKKTDFKARYCSRKKMCFALSV